MSPSSDPLWLPAAVRIYGACLWLYPKALRDAHGQEMRQAFRDRCRELGRGRPGAWRLFAAELAPDLFASAARAHVQTGSTNDARVLPGLFLLTLLCAALASQPHWSGAALDAIKATERNAKMLREARELNFRKALVHDLSKALAAKGDDTSTAVAALLQRALYDQQQLWLLWPDDDAAGSGGGPRPVRFSDEAGPATALAAKVVVAGGSSTALSIATQACTIQAGCNEDRALRQLLARDPENAFGWMLAFRRAAQRGDAARMQAALDGTRGARYFESHVGTVHRLFFAQLIVDHGDDAAAVAEGADQFRRMQGVFTDDLPDSLFVHCSLRPVATGIPKRWIDLHPDARASCIHLAGLLAGSSDLMAASWGWRQLHRAGGPMSPAQWQAMREAVWLEQQAFQHRGGHHSPDGRHWTEFTREEWLRWNASWRDDGEAAALRRWLQAEGLPTRPPADFDVERPNA